MQDQGLFNKDCLNVGRSKDLRKKGKPSKKNSNKRAKILQQETRIWKSKKIATDTVRASIRKKDRTIGNLV